MFNLKSILKLILLIPTFNLLAQFPAPTDFSYQLDYIELNQWGVCLGQTVYGPSFCSHFRWKMPDTSLTGATLEYYEIYNVFEQDTNLIHNLSDTTFTTTVPYEGDLFVVAVYSNPQGKSEPSNIINNPGIPINIYEAQLIPEITIKHISETELLQIESIKRIVNIKILSINGQILYNEGNINHFIYIGNLKPGLYIIEFIDDDSHILREKFIK
jgi:hypothetical protein